MGMPALFFTKPALLAAPILWQVSRTSIAPSKNDDASPNRTAETAKPKRSAANAAEEVRDIYPRRRRGRLSKIASEMTRALPASLWAHASVPYH